MKQFSSKPLLTGRHSIIGKITFKPVAFFRRKKFIFVSAWYQGRIGLGYAAILTTSPRKSSRRPTFLCTPLAIQQLTEGDIVSIGPHGQVTVLYETNAVHNFLLTTERCNSSCIMCPNPLVTEEEDKTAGVLKLISLIDPKTPVLGISGGEPTLLGDRLIEILRACKKKLPRTGLLLLTNGIKFEDFNYVQKIVAVQHPDLTIDIPLHSDTDTDHDNMSGTNGFYKTIEGLYNLARFDQKIGLRIVVHQLNYKRLLQIAEFIYHNFPFVSHIAFMQMEVSGEAKINLDRLWIDPYNCCSELEQAVTYLSRRAMNVSIFNVPLCVLPRTLWRYARQSISTWKNIYLDECKACDYKNYCAGFFASSKDWHSDYIRAMKLDFTFSSADPSGIDSNQKFYASTKSYRKFLGEQWVYFSPNSRGFPIVVTNATNRIFEAFENGRTVQEAKDLYLLDASSSFFSEDEWLASVFMLAEKGFLRKDPEPLKYQAASLAELQHIKTMSLWVHMTNQCNLQCEYCFVTKSNQEMNEQTIQKIVTAVVSTAKRYQLQEVKINFAGGEPTLVMDKIELFYRLLQAGLKDIGTKLSISIVSNGTLVNDTLLDFLKQENCGMGISLDGYGAKGHDIYRKFKNTHQGSWQLIEENIQRLIDNGVTPYIMSTLSASSVATLTELMRWVIEKGLSTRLSIISHANSNCAQPSCSGGVQSEQLSTYIDAFEAMFTELEKPQYSFDVGEVMRIGDLHFEYPAYTSCCELAAYHLAISHEGKLTFCPMDINRAHIELGDDLLVSLRRTISFDTCDRNQSQHQACLKCQWFPVCVGGCLYSNMQLYQSPFARPLMHDFYRYVIPRYIEFYGKKLLQQQEKIE